MVKTMLIDATHEEETRVAIIDGKRLVEYDYESKLRKPLKGSVFLAKVTRVEPSLQAAFVNFGGNRHGFLPFSEIHPDYFRIPIADREALLAEQEEFMKQHEEEEAQEQEEEQQQEQREESESGDGVSDEDGEDRPDEGMAGREDDDSEGNIEHIEDEYVIEEVGGTEEPQGRNVADKDDAESQEGDLNDNIGNERDESEGETSEGQEGESGGERQGREGERGRGRRGRYGRGRHGGGRGRRMQHRSRNVESLGGDTEDGDRRFRFNLRRKYKIQEVIKRGQIMLIQASKEERGNKGAAVTTYLSLPGRYCVLMPNSPRAGGVSRKIANYQDRARMKEILEELKIPEGMSVIVRTAGVARSKVEIKRDLDYLVRLWDTIREDTLKSSAPALIYEEADLIKRAIRDLYGRDVDEIHVAGEEGFKAARQFMKMLIPSHIKKIFQYEESRVPLFHKHHVESQINDIGEPRVTLKSGGYMIINPTEALVSVDVNSGKATKERHIEETALKTNLEAAAEVARQLRLRDLGGLIVIDFIDMEDRRNNAKVERKLKEALSTDRARIQVGRISSFGLLELSRQRMNPSLTEAQFNVCPHCKGAGVIRTCDAMSIVVLRAIEEEGMRGRAAQIIVHVSNDVALYILNNKKSKLADIEKRYNFTILTRVDETIAPSSYRIEVAKPAAGYQERGEDKEDEDVSEGDDNHDADGNVQHERSAGDPSERKGRRRGRRGGRRRRGGHREGNDRNFGNDRAAREGGREAAPDENFNRESGNEDLHEPEKPRRHERNREERPSRERGRGHTSEHTRENAPARKQEVTEDSAKSEPSAPPVQPRRAESAPRNTAPKEHEIVNEPPKKKKSGWWNKLTE